MPEQYIPPEARGIKPEEQKLTPERKPLKHMVRETVAAREQEKGEKLTPEELAIVMDDCRKTSKMMDDMRTREPRYQWYKDWHKGEMERVGKRPGSKLYKLGRELFERIVFKFLKTQVEVKGREHIAEIPKDKGFLIVAPHMSQVDPQLLMTQLKEHELNFLAGQVCNFKNGFWNRALLNSGAIPILEPRRKDFQESSPHSWEFQDTSLSKEEYAGFAQMGVDVAAKRIHDGHAVVIFPEGPVMARNQKEVRRATRGPARILQTLAQRGMTAEDMMILPIGIQNSSSIVENPIGTSIKDVHRGGRADITIGKPFTFAEVTQAAGEDLQQQSDYIMGKVAELMPEELRGPYRTNQNI